jgi:membrane-associated protein
VRHAIDAIHNIALLPGWLDPETMLRAFGPYVLIALCAIVFAECGLLVGFFLPGDSLLFTAGLFAASGLIGAPIWLVCTLLTVCAIAGNMVGYWIGAKTGPALFSRPSSRFFKTEYVEKTHEFFQRYGASAIVLARFVPIIRTFITAMAGVGRMEPKRYFTYSVIGGTLWATGVTLLGYWLGNVPFVRHNIEAMLILIVVLSVLPIAFEFARARRKRTRMSDFSGGS